MKVVVVESPAKAKTINKYLGDDYKVIASVGHIRDLPPKDGSVDPEEDFSMKWEVPSRSRNPINDITGALKGASKLILATDPDREGEAISWHVREVMEKKNALDAVPVERVVFNEITKGAILEAMEKPREINNELVEAYLARRALDYLVGFSISPVLWRKLPGAKSAGRVQSVALKLICEREGEIEAFNPVEYWSVEAELKKEDGSALTARLTHLGRDKLRKYDLATEADAMRAVEAINNSDFTIEKVDTRRVNRNPSPPFTTSTMQQEASRKLGFSAKRTMQIAQKLYEGIDIGSETTGLITYMRTDGVQLSGEAISAIRKTIVATKGDRYLPPSPRVYKSRAANAQEAHEAIRPTSMTHPPEDVARYLNEDQRKLYELIWRRTLASQMQSAEIDQTSADIVDRDGKATLRATGSVIVFDGFLTMYREGRDDAPSGSDDDENGNGNGSGNGKDAAPATEEEDRRFLPPLASGDALGLASVKPEQHFTQPPPRYTDASLVKRMEELGIGRPSTYSSIISVLQDREYVIKDKARFIPQHTGRIVSAFLESFFTRYVEYGFTARLEEDLDRVSDGQLKWKQLLADFWKDFKAQIDGMTDLTRGDVLKEVDTLLAPHFFPVSDNGEPVRKCENCGDGILGLQMGRYGAFIGCSNYPECRYTRQLGEGDNAHDGFTEGEKTLGQDSETGMDVLMRKGPYGLYIQRGGVDEKKPKRCGIPKQMDFTTIDLAVAMKLLALPREIGPHPETGDGIFAGIGRYGPFLRYAGAYASLPPDDTVLTIGINHAVEIIEEAGIKPPRNLGKPESIPVVQNKEGKDVVTEPEEITEIMVKTGRFGPYVEMGEIRASIPKTMDAEEISLDDAIGLIAKKKANPRRWGKKKKAAKKKTKTKAKAKTKKKSAKKTKAKTESKTENESPAPVEKPNE